MFKRKTFIVAFLAVVLLVSFMDARVSVDQRHRRKPRAAVADGIMAVDPTLRQASIGNRMRQVAGGIAAVDTNNGQASIGNLIRQVAGGIAAVDPNNGQASIANLMHQVAGGIAALDPSNG